MGERRSLSDVRKTEKTVTTTSVHRIGGEIALDHTVSWAPPGASGSQEVSAYLVRGASGAVLVDTGLRLHEDAVLAQLSELLEDGQPLSVLLTRTEMECCLNLPAIEAAFGLDAVWYTGGITVPRSHAEVRRVSVEPGTSQWVEPYPGLRLELISPMMRLLPTLWVYEPETASLLTSDAFTHGGVDGRPVESGLQKFAWFTRAETTAIAAHVRRVVEERPVALIGPGYGSPFEGANTVTAQALMLAVAIEKVGVR